MCVLFVRLLLLCPFALLLPVFAQQDEASTTRPTPSGEQPEPQTWVQTGKLSFLTVSGLLDGYYSFNKNHPATGKNYLHNFDVGADRFDLNMAKLTLEHTADPVGFRVDAGFGRAFDVIHASSNAEPDPFRNILQAYVTARPKQLGGFQADFGKFLTSAGAELTETQLNWNYSRSLLFANGPYFHFGLRTSMPFGKHFVGGVQVLQGWNNVIDNNGGKTLGFVANLTGARVSWANTYLTGPEKTHTSAGRRNFYDTVLTVTPGGMWSYYLNFDYGQEKNLAGAAQNFLGIAAAAHCAITKKISFSPRLEWYNDAGGLITGTRQQLKEGTITGEYIWLDGLLSRLEYRHDWSTEAVFDRASQRGRASSQDTLVIGLVAFFGPKH